MPQFWKVLNADRTAYHGGTGRWPAPSKWLEVTGEIVPCRHGLHVCRREDLVRWLGPTIWEVEVEGEQLADEHKVVVRRARLVKQLTTWNDRTARVFACDCAEAVLSIYEKVGKSPAPRNAIAVARRFANGEATDEEMAAARDAAWDAAWDAVRDAVRDAARAAQTDRLFAVLYPQ